MDLSPVSQRSHVLPTLPVELVDDIVDEATRTLDASSISYIALTSHGFRIHANKARFSALTPSRSSRYNIPRIATGIRNLAAVIRSGHSIGTMPGVGAFATSFSLHMDGYYEEVTPVLRDPYLAYVLDNLFRSQTPISASPERTLSLSVYRRYRPDDEDVNLDLPSPDSDDPRYGPLRWNHIDSILLKALEDMLRHSQINRLILVDIRNIPPDFLQGSKIKHLNFRTVSLRDYNSHGQNYIEQRLEPLLLESLDIDRSMSFEDIAFMTHLHRNISVSSGTVLPSLTSLSLDVSDTYDFQKMNKILNNAPSLQSLTMRLHLDYTYYAAHRDICAIDYNHLAHLKTISFTNGVTSPLSLISHLITHDVPPSLDELHVELLLYSYMGLGSVTKPLEDQDLGVLDSHFIHPSFDTIKRIVISLKVGLSGSDIKVYKTPVYLAQWRDYITSKVPLLLEKNAGLEILVTWKY